MGQRMRIRLDTQTDVANFVNIANQIKGNVFLVDNTFNKVNGKSLMGCLYSLEFNDLYVVLEDETKYNKFTRFCF
jgi:hypothetical protein